ncbi:MAG: hypothetical protein AB3A66_20640 [Nodularia sp. CChRGM 3473]
MAWLYGSDAVQQLSENVVLYDLAQMRGNSAVLNRIPDNIGGVYLTGIYTLSEGVALPYVLSLVDINRAIDELKIAEQIPASLDTKWSLKELFQREIDEKRVEDDIVKGYLLDPNKLKFFNAITIVLMPKDSDGKIQNAFDETTNITPPPIPWDGTDPDDEQWKNFQSEVANFGGIQFVSTGVSARLRWMKIEY